MPPQKPDKNDPKKDAQQKLNEFRGMIAKIAIAVLTVSGWIFLFMNGAQTVTQPDPQAAAKKAEEERKATGIPASMQKGEKKEGTFVMSYCLVLLSVGLGLMFVTGASNRRDRAHVQQYEGAQMADEDG